MDLRHAETAPIRQRLAEWLREGAWLDPVREHLRSAGLPDDQLRAVYVRARPPDTALVGFHTEGRPENHAPPVHGYFAFLPADRIRQAVEHLHRRHGGRLAPHKTALPDKGLLICTLPADRRIRGARALVEMTALKRSLHRGWSELIGQDLRVRARKSHSVVVRYKPERRLVSLLDISLADERNGRREQRTLYGRAYAHGRVEARVGDSRMLAAIVEASGSFRVATPVGFDSRMGTAYYAELPGISLDRLAGAESLQAWREAGRALARLHAMPTPFARRLDARAISFRLELLAKALSLVDPDLEERASRLALSLRRSVPEITRLSPIHGDLHARQLLWDGARAGLVDYDELASGDPAVDLATCLAHLEAAEVSASNGADSVPMGQALMDGYAELGPRLITASAFRWFLTWALLEVAISPFRSLEDDCPGRCHALVVRAERTIGGKTPWL